MTHLGVWVNLKTTIRRYVEGGDLRNVVILTLTLFLLELERDTADGSLLNALHQVGGETRDLVTETLRGDNSL